MSQHGQTNLAFVTDDQVRMQDDIIFNNLNTDKDKHNDFEENYRDKRKLSLPYLNPTNELVIEEEKKIEIRSQWGNSIEFLMSCIAMSIGLGNVWRFPFTAYENGGGAFLIPYVIVLFLVGKPIYYLEMIRGQFSNKSSVKVWSMMPAFRGIGWAQMFSMACLATYYCALMAITLFYLVASFQTVLPWSTCLPEWGDGCVDSNKSNVTNLSNGTFLQSSAELYFKKSVLKEKENINNGIGLPDWKLVVYLLITWCCISGILTGGVKSSGKAAYFLAIFPYIVMIAILIRAVTLEGAVEGIIFFIKPNWKKLFHVKVWYAAVTQCFFSVSVGFGAVIMYSSYNNFHHNIHRDVTVITLLDTFTSLLAGFTIFGILGNLAHELGVEDISHVIRGGTGLAFISYPDAISKFTVLSQLFSILFFLMLYILGIGSGVGIIGGVITIVQDQFPHWKNWHIVLGISILGFCIGTVYCTPGGQFILNLVDHYASSFIVFLIAIFEITVIFWIYGLENFLDDVEFMLNRRPSIYWRISWVFITPIVLITIFIYTLITLTPLTYANISYPQNMHIFGWILLTTGAVQIPFWFIYTILSKRHLGFRKMIFSVFKPSKNWGPLHYIDAWRQFKEEKRNKRNKRTASRLTQFIYVLFGQEKKLS